MDVYHAIPNPPEETGIHIERSDGEIVFSGEEEISVDPTRWPPQFRAMMAFGSIFIKIWKLLLLLIFGGGLAMMVFFVCRDNALMVNDQKFTGMTAFLIKTGLLLGWTVIGLVMWLFGRGFSRRFDTMRGTGMPSRWRLTLTPSEWNVNTWAWDDCRQEGFAPVDVRALELASNGALVARVFDVNLQRAKEIVLVRPSCPRQAEWLLPVLKKHLSLRG